MTSYTRIKGRHNNCPGNDKELQILINNQWELFKKTNGHYPTAQEIDQNHDMVPSRTIQRRLGGVKNVRTLLNHKIINYSEGETRSNTASICNTRSINEEIEITNYLYGIFGNRPSVCKQETYTDNSQVRSDVGVYTTNEHFFVDVFSAKDKFSILGCINHKYNKIKNLSIGDNIFYVSTNTNLSQELIDSLLKNKKNKLPANIKVLTVENFKKYCETLTPSIQ